MHTSFTCCAKHRHQYTCMCMSSAVILMPSSSHSLHSHTHPTAFTHTLIPQPSLAHSSHSLHSHTHPTTLTGTLTHNPHWHTHPQLSLTHFSLPMLLPTTHTQPGSRPQAIFGSLQWNHEHHKCQSMYPRR